MKKLLVVALSLVMIFSIAAVAMAAVTMGGEFNYGWYLGQPKTITYADPDDITTGTEADTQLGSFGNAKLAVTADLSDSIKGFATFKSSDNMDKVFIDES